MDLSVLFLGTSGSMPTVQRAPTSLLIRRGGDRLLLDCGEGTQRQLLRSVGLPDIEHVFLTHFHADHFLGLPGMSIDVMSFASSSGVPTIVNDTDFAGLFMMPVIGTSKDDPGPTVPG